MLEKLVERIDSCEITEGDADRLLAGEEEPEREGWLRYCRDNCDRVSCALGGFGVELVGVDYGTLSDADKARYDFYRSIYVNRYITEITLGVVL